jgi:hypothetical protein
MSNNFSAKSIASGLFLGLTFGNTYEAMTPQIIPRMESLPALNPNANQFDLQCLNPQETARLRELQAMDLIQDSVDPEPDDHLWRCIAVT